MRVRATFLVRACALLFLFVGFNNFVRAADIPGGFEGVRGAECSNPRPVLDAPFVLSQAALWGSVYWDFSSTFGAFERCPTCYEGNPHMRSYVLRGKRAVWEREAAFNLALGGVSLGSKAIFRKSPHWILRHAWLIPPVILAGAHVSASIHNGRQ